jgi:hypothetical protein
MQAPPDSTAPLEAAVIREVLNRVSADLGTLPAQFCDDAALLLVAWNEAQPSQPLPMTATSVRMYLEFHSRIRTPPADEGGRVSTRG